MFKVVACSGPRFSSFCGLNQICAKLTHDGHSAGYSWPKNIQVLDYDKTLAILVWFGCAGPRFWDPVMGLPIFQGYRPLAQGGLNPLQQGSWSSKLPGIREGSYGQFNPNTTNSCDLTPLMCGTKQNWNSVWQEGPYDNHNAPRTKLYLQRGLELILGWMRLL